MFQTRLFLDQLGTKLLPGLDLALQKLDPVFLTVDQCLGVVGLLPERGEGRFFLDRAGFDHLRLGLGSGEIGQKLRFV